MTAVTALSRGLVIAFWLATSACAFLSAVPFVHEHFLQPGLVPALAAVARWHRWLTLASVRWSPWPSGPTSACAASRPSPTSIASLRRRSRLGISAAIEVTEGGVVAIDVDAPHRPLGLDHLRA